MKTKKRYIVKTDNGKLIGKVDTPDEVRRLISTHIFQQLFRMKMFDEKLQKKNELRTYLSYLDEQGLDVHFEITDTTI